MKNIKAISFILILLLIINLLLPIIVNASNEQNTQNEINNYMENNENNIINEIEDEKIVPYSLQEELSVKYCSHVQDIGWQEDVNAGEQSGTTGKNLKIEAIKISLVNNTSNINIRYKSYVQGTGWQNEVKNGEMAGTTGKNLKMEAIKIWLENTNEYSVMYRTHIQDFGWQDWTYDGTISGKLGDNKKIEAIEIKIVPKADKKMSVTYSSHVQDIGWQAEKEELDISGTTGRNLKIEALKINLKDAPSGVSVKYKTYVQGEGWHSWIQKGEISGTTGKNLRVYGIRIQLEGTNDYSIQYRAHIQDYGWSEWKKDGEVVGKIAENKKIEAIQIRVIKTKNTNTTSIGVEYYTYLQGSASNENKVELNGEISGTTGQNRKLQGIQITLINAPSGAHIKYKTHVQDIGWMDWVKDDKISGVIESDLKIEAIKIELEGLKDYTVEYKAHVQDKGWTDWYIDGETAGTTGQNKKIEAIQIRIVTKYRRYFKGIDVSYWQNNINYDKLVASGQIDFMIARIGWYSNSQSKLNVDTQFERNYKEARKRNIPLGAYFYSYATSVDEAKIEAQSVVNYLKNSGQTTYELPIFYDIEHNSQISLGKDTITQMSIAFCDILKNAGYQVGVYSYSYWLENYMNLSKLPKDYSIWVANYGSNDTGDLPDDIYKYSDTHDIWQYTSSGKVDGIDGNVDMNISYRKYF